MRLPRKKGRVFHDGQWVDPVPPAPEPSPAEAEAVAEAESRAHAAAIVEICVGANVGNMAAGLILEGVTVEVARERAGGATEIRSRCRATRKIAQHVFEPDGYEATVTEFVRQYAAGRITPDMLSDILLNRMVDQQSFEIRGTPLGGFDREEPANHGWDKIIERVYAERAKAMGQKSK